MRQQRHAERRVGIRPVAERGHALSFRPSQAPRCPVVTVPLSTCSKPGAARPGPGLRRGAAALLALGLAAVLGAGASAAPAATAASAAAKPSAPVLSTHRFTFHGLTPVSADRTLAKAEVALGAPLVREAAPAARPGAAAASAAAGPAPTCHYRVAAGQPGVRYTVANDMVTRIETRDPRYATVSGVHVGDSLDRVQQAYGKRLVSTPHPYFDKGQVLAVYSPDRRFALVMESNDSGRVITLRSGRQPDVAWLEGCS
jgi:hypothetical protein